MSLADHYDTNGQYLRAGEHRVDVKSLKFFTYNSGSRGVEFICGNDHGTSKLSICLKDSCLWKLANFAMACGVSRDEARRCDPEREQGFDIFIGRAFLAVVEAESAGDKSYHHIADFAALDDQPAKPPMVKPRRATSPPPDDERPPIEEPHEEVDHVPF